MPPSQNEIHQFPQPANARPPAPPADRMPTQPASPASQASTSPVGSHATVDMASALRQFTGQESFVFDGDVRMALEDMCGAAEGKNWKARWPQWLSQFINEAVRGYLGR